MVSGRYPAPSLEDSLRVAAHPRTPNRALLYTHRLARRRFSRGASAPGVTAVPPPLQGSGSRRHPEGSRPSAVRCSSEPRDVGRLCERSHWVPAWFQADTRPLHSKTRYGSRLTHEHPTGRCCTPIGWPASQPRGVSPRGHGSTATAAGFGVAPPPRGLTPIGWAASQPWGVSPRGHGSTATAAGFGVVPQPRGLTPIGWPASQPWGVSPRGHGSMATAAGFGVVPPPRGLTPIGWQGGEPAVGREPPGSRLNGHRCRGFGVVPQPRGLTPIGWPASQPWGVSPRGYGSTATAAGGSRSFRNPGGLRPSAGRRASRGA